MSTDNSKAVKAFFRRKEKEGLKQVRVWVPLDKVEEIKEIAKKMVKSVDLQV